MYTYYTKSLTFISQLLGAKSNDEIRTLVDSEEFAFRFDAGVTMPSTSVTLENKEEVAGALAMHYLVYSCKGELDQFKQGLSCLGMLELARRHPQLMRPLFLSSGKVKLTASKFLNLFKVCWSPMGSNRKDREDDVIYAWTEYVHSCDGKCCIRINFV